MLVIYIFCFAFAVIHEWYGNNKPIQESELDVKTGKICKQLWKNIITRLEEIKTR